LTRSQLEAVHWSSVGRPQSLDEEIMAYAAKHGYVVLTNDLDFGAILAVTHREKPSVVQIRLDNLSPGIIGPQMSRLSGNSKNTFKKALRSSPNHCVCGYACYRSLILNRRNGRIHFYRSVTSLSMSQGHSQHFENSLVT
jgi:predicted nuclease of predicted toxin-antitoxin system